MVKLAKAVGRTPTPIKERHHTRFLGTSMMRSQVHRGGSLCSFGKLTPYAQPIVSFAGTIKSDKCLHHAVRFIKLSRRSMSATSKLKKWKTKKTGKKLKTRQAAAKRFILNGKGNLKRGHQGKRHNTSPKSMVRLRRLNKSQVMEPSSRITKNVQKLIIRHK